MFLGALALTVLVSCNTKEEKTTEIVAPESTTDTLVVKEEAAPTTTTTEVETTTEKADGTSVNVGSDGVSLDTKNGTKSTNVEVKDGGASLEIKK